MAVKLRYRHIESFRAVMQTGTATGAASLLNVTQPAVSALMAEMESVVGFTLFDRRGGRLVPTTSAVLLFEEVERCFTGLDHLNAFCSQLGRSQASAVVIATAPSMALSLLPIGISRHLREIARDFFTLLPRHSDEAIRLVGSQKADLGFGSKPVTLPGFHCEPVSTHELLCVLPLGHRLTERTHVESADLRGEPFIVMSRDEGIFDPIEKVLTERGVEIEEVAETTLTTGACALVEQGVGITLTEHGAASLFLGRNVVFRRFSPSIPATFYAYWLEKRDPAFKRNAFISILKEEGLNLSLRLDEEILK